MLSLLDTDLILMRAATASETEIDWGEDNVWSLYMDLEDAKTSVASRLLTSAMQWRRIILSAACQIPMRIFAKL